MISFIQVCQIDNYKSAIIEYCPNLRILNGMYIIVQRNIFYINRQIDVSDDIIY